MVDCGCTIHMTSNKNILNHFKKQNSTLVIANDETMLVKDQGNLLGQESELENTLLIPELSQNLLSVNAVRNNDGSVLFTYGFTKDSVEIYNKEELVVSVKKENELYRVTI